MKHTSTQHRNSFSDKNNKAKHFFKLYAKIMFFVLLLGGLITACGGKDEPITPPITPPPTPKTDQPAVYNIGTLPNTMSLNGTTLTIPETTSNADLKKIFEAGTVTDPDGKAGITAVSINGDKVTVTYFGVDGAKPTQHKTHTQVFTINRITANIVAPNFSDNIKVGERVDLLDGIQPANTIVNSITIGDEQINIDNVHDFSPQFPGKYTINYQYTNKKGKSVTASTTLIFHSIDSPAEIDMQKYTFENIDDEGSRNLYRYKLLEKYGIYNFQTLAKDLLENDGFKNISHTEALQRISSLTPLIFDKSISDNEDSLDGGKILMDQENSRNYALGSKEIFSKDWGGATHPANVTSTGFGHNNASTNNLAGVGSGGILFQHLQENHDHKGVILLTTNDSNAGSRANQITNFITKIQSRPDKNFIIFWPNSWDWSLRTDPSEKQKMIDNLHTLAHLPNVIVCIAGTDNSNNGTIVGENETPGEGEYQTFPASVDGIRGASSSTGQGEQLLYKMPTTSKDVVTILAKYPTGGSTSASVGDIAGEVFNVATIFPKKNNTEIREVFLNKKNHFEVKTQDGQIATEIGMDYTKVPFNELFPEGVPNSLNYGEEKELFEKNEWLKDKMLFAQGDLVRYDETTKKYYLDTKTFAQRGGFTDEQGNLVDTATSTVKIYIKKIDKTNTYLFKKEIAIKVKRK